MDSKEDNVSGIRSEKKLEEYLLPELTAEVKKLVDAIDETLLEKFLKLGRYACRAKKLVEKENDSWNDYVSDNFSHSRHRINEAIAAYRAYRKFKKENKNKELPPAFTKSVLTKTGQMLRSKNKASRKSARHLLGSGEVKTNKKTIKAGEAKATQVLDALKKQTKTSSVKNTKATSTSKIEDRLQVYKQYLTEVSKYFHRSGLVSLISTRKSKKDCLRAIIEEAENICKECKKLLKQTKQAK